MLEIYDNIQDDHFNSLLIEVLQGTPGWTLAIDRNCEDEGEDKSKYSDRGFLRRTYCTMTDPSMVIPIDFLNESAYHIFRKTTSLAGLENAKPLRYLWNYYNRSSYGVWHTDYNAPRVFSIVYYVNTNDGGTMIGDTLVDAISGRAVVFKAQTLHKGMPPVKSENRFVLNILFTADRESEE